MSDAPLPDRVPFALLRRRLDLLRWAMPAVLLGLVVLYEAGPARWLLERFGAGWHLTAEILVYGTLGPLLTYWVITLVERWLEERETSELQAQILAEARARSALNQRLNDDVLQGLFAVSMLLKSAEAGAAPEAAAALHNAELTLDQAIRQLREQLHDGPPLEP